MLKPIQTMLERVLKSKDDSDTTYFFDLLYAAEFIVKLSTASLVAAIQDDREGHRYRLVHRLVRADGIGEWSNSLEEALGGTASQHLTLAAKDDRRAYTERVDAAHWQHDATRLLIEAAATFSVRTDVATDKLALRTWYNLFPTFRNKTRGHGAPTKRQCAEASNVLAKSIEIIAENHPTLSRDWAYLHRNLSGKYRVVPLQSTSSKFDALKSAPALAQTTGLIDGVHVYFDSPVRVELLQTDVDLSDYFVPNGAFDGKTFEIHSPITDSIRKVDATPYLATAAERPESETHGLGNLEVLGEVWANLPAPPPDYIARPALEEDLISTLHNNRHPIVTLVGRGGIGKTSLALQALRQTANTKRFGAILWFSARDIDLMASGPKLVKPGVLTETDIARQFTEMMAPKERSAKGFNSNDYLADGLAESPIGDPILFVFDNFETLRNPVDLFAWLDSNIRLPNKILITSRFRDFKADYPIEVGGMTKPQIVELIQATATALGRIEPFSKNLQEDIFEQSDGHPYIAKIMIGEVFSGGVARKPERIVAEKEDILQALFERTFSNLSPLARRVFLTLSGWRSFVPQIGLEAICYRASAESIDPGSAIDELIRMSLAQRRTADDGSDFIGLPLSALLFGQRKLATSPLRASIESDLGLLQDLGPTSSSSIHLGIGPRVQRLFTKMAERIVSNKIEFAEMQPALEFVAQRHRRAWLYLADLVTELEPVSDEKAKEYLRRYIEVNPSDIESRSAWRRLAEMYRAENDVVAACSAFLQAFGSADTPYFELSNVANWLNHQKQAVAEIDAIDRRKVFSAFASLMERRLSEAGAKDLSRLAWLHLHGGDERRALTVAQLGLKEDPENEHCRRLVARLE